MKRQDFDFYLPPELIAQYPTDKRSASRMLCLSGSTGCIQHQHFYDLPTMFEPGDLLVFNDSRVMPARLHGHKATGGQVELLIERILDQQSALAHIRASKSPQLNSLIYFDDDHYATVTHRIDELYQLHFPTIHSVLDFLKEKGEIPLPPYIRRKPKESDKDRYQTIYAQQYGAVAAPTAGLHFDDDTLKQLDEKGIERTFLTLHVGAGTFQPVRVEDIVKHKMHSEYIEVSQSVCDKIVETKKRGNRVIAVGTTTVRSLETAAQSGELQPFYGDTDIFIYPGYQFKVIDALLTNFHLPESTLLMLVSAFAGYKETMTAYKEAVSQEYRFFSYGDVMLINPRSASCGHSVPLSPPGRGQR